MIHIKLFEDFDPAEDEGPSYYVLKDGRFLAFYEEPFEDMAGETNYMYKYFVGDKPGDKDYEKIQGGVMEGHQGPANARGPEATRKRTGGPGRQQQREISRLGEISSSRA